MTFTRALIGASLALAASAAFARSEIRSVTAKKVGEGIEISIRGSELEKPKELRANKNAHYILEFASGLSAKPSSKAVNFAGVDTVRYGWYSANPPRVRVTIKLDPSEKPLLIQDRDTWKVLINLPDPRVTPKQPATTAGTLAGDDNGAILPPVPRPGAEPANSAATGQDPDPFTGKFPDKVPPLEPASKVMGGAKPQDGGMPAMPTANRGPLVTLDFVSTDVAQILKALSIESGFNIVVAPEVSPADAPRKVTVSLKQVSVDDALSFVTALSQLRYSRVGSTYVVTRAEDHVKILRAMVKGTNSFETKVVNLVSGEAQQIKEAVLTAYPQDGRDGFYDVIVPGKDDSLISGGNIVSNPESGEGLSAQSNPQGGQPPVMLAPKRAHYLMVIGDPSRVDQVADYVRELDMNVANSYARARMENMQTAVVPIVSGQTEVIVSMLEKMIKDSPRRDDFSIKQSAIKELAEGDVATQVLMLAGPGDDIEQFALMARTLDSQLATAAGIKNSPEDLIRDYKIVDLYYIEPLVAAQDLKGRIRGLHVTVLPDPVTPGITGEDESKKSENPTDPNAGEEPTTNQESELTRQVGREPMRLVLRGTAQAISEAERYLSQVDIPPRQVALELRVMELTKEEANTIGIDWSLLTGGSLVNLGVNQGTGRTSIDPGTVDGSIGDGGFGFDFLLTLDKMNGGRNLIARPNTIISDGRMNAMFVGDTIRYVKQIQATQTGTSVITDELDVGVNFDVKARIGGGGQIALDLFTNFSILNRFDPIPGGGQLPQTSERRNTMQVNMRSGETIALGGLIQDIDRKSRSGIPILMDLPIIGRLFSRTTTSTERTEIVFFLTAVEVDQSTRSNAANPRSNSMRGPNWDDAMNGGGLF